MINSYVVAIIGFWKVNVKETVRKIRKKMFLDETDLSAVPDTACVVLANIRDVNLFLMLIRCYVKKDF